METTTSWKKKTEEGVPHKHRRYHHRRDGRDSDQRRNRRRGRGKVVWVRDSPSVRRARRHGSGVCLLEDEGNASDDDDDDNHPDQGQWFLTWPKSTLLCILKLSAIYRRIS